jgi:hypothetical protein
MGLLIYYTTLVIITTVITIIAQTFLRLFFRSKEKISNSPYNPIIKGLTVLSTAYLTRFGLNNLTISLIGYLGKGTDNKDFLLLLNSDQISSSTMVDLVFYGLVTLIIIIYIFIAFNKRRIESVITQPQIERLKIEFPEDKQLTIPVFSSRLKKLIELKYEKENLVLEFDKKYNVLFGSYKQGLHNHTLLIFCDECVYSKTIMDDEINTAEEAFINILEIINFEFNSLNILTRKYIVEKGSFDLQNSNRDILFFSEDDYLNYAINFSKYLEQLIHSFEEIKLPFSNDSENKRTLNSTFIKQNYTIGSQRGYKKTPLDVYLEDFLKETSLRHIVVLGDYGMGKSTLLKYYASLIAKEILYKKKIIRFPVFIPLTNSSPRHGGIDYAIGKFVADNLGVSSKLFMELVYRGKIIFLLDGFDEMGFIGTHGLRIKQFNAIWKLATRNNKIIIAGRPSYFPTNEELNIAFNIKDADESIPTERPFFERLNLKPFNKDQIQKSLSKYYKGKDLEKYFAFIWKNKSIYELCRRPSLMHIVREMLPSLFKEYADSRIEASMLIEKYLKHWIERQFGKQITASIDNNKIKEQFVFDFFQKLGGEYYKKKTYKLPSYEVLSFLGADISPLGLSTKEEKEGFETEILTSYFIEIENDEYRFVHKSFLEYFVSKEILKLIKNKNYKDPLIAQCDWSEDIINFIYESEEFQASSRLSKSIPLLLTFASRNIISAKIKSIVFLTKVCLYWMFTFLPKFILSFASFPSNLVVSSDNSDKVFSKIELLLSDEYIKSQLLRFNKNYKTTDIQYALKNRKLSNSLIFTLSNVLEQELLTIENEWVIIEKRPNVGIAAKAYYVALLKGQFKYHDSHPIPYYLRRKLYKRIKQSQNE